MRFCLVEVKPLSGLIKGDIAFFRVQRELIAMRTVICDLEAFLGLLELKDVGNSFRIVPHQPVPRERTNLIGGPYTCIAFDLHRVIDRVDVN